MGILDICTIITASIGMIIILGLWVLLLLQ